MDEFSTLDLSHSSLSESEKHPPNRPFGESGALPDETSGGVPAGGEMTIGEMARAFAVSLRTLRFYEHRGLIRPRRDGAARYYSGVDGRRLAMILKGKRLGFTLGEIADLLVAQPSDGSADFEETLQPEQIINQLGHLERQRSEIDGAIERLRATHKKLERIA